MIERNRKLPQSRYYLRAANYGINALLDRKPMNEGFLFFGVGILASLRAVQHALLNHDSTLSDQHKEVIEAWKKSTPMNGPEITFIKTSRDLILKEGTSNAFVGLRQGGTFEGERFKVTREIYDAGYYVDGERRDLIAEMRAAADWCDRELTAIEAKVPAINLPGDMVEYDIVGPQK
jgi:hypothetical protein